MARRPELSSLVAGAAALAVAVLAGCTSPANAPAGGAATTARAAGGNPAPEPADEWQWLEEVDSPRALAWARERNAQTRERLLRDKPAFEALRADLQRVLDDPSRIPFITPMGGHVYNFWTDASHPRGNWRRTTLADYRRDNPSWTTLIDVDELGRREGVRWV